MSGRIDALLRAVRAAQGRVVVIGHDRADVDSVLSCVLLARLLERLGGHAVPALPGGQDRQSLRVCGRLGVREAFAAVTQETDSLLLVDHHQPTQPGRVMACIDHHMTACPPQYAYTQIEPAGACAAIIYRLMQEAGVQQEDDLRLAVCALYLDTIALRSTKIAPEEAAWAKRCAQQLSLDTAWLESEGMGLMDVSRPAQELAMTGLKEYRYGGRRVLSTYIQTDALTQALLERILCVLRGAIREKAAARWVFLVHNPRAGCSLRYDVFPSGQVRETRYDRLISRGSDVMPQVEREMMEEMADE